MPKTTDKKSTAKAKMVLIIEDNFFMAELLAEKIGHQGLRTVSAHDGREGLERLAEEKPDLVLLDLPLAGEVDGLETLRRIRALYDAASLPVILLFNLADAEAIQAGLKLGANGYLIKAYATTDEIVTTAKDTIFSDGKVPMEKMIDKIKLSDISPKGKVKIAEERARVLGTPEPKEQKKPDGGPNVAAPRKLQEKIEQMLKLPETEVSIISLVDSLMEYAFLARASDIHVEPTEDNVIARLRIDGILHDMFSIPKNIQSGVITRLKVLAGMRTDEHQAAQDGRFKIELKELSREFDVRVSIVPTYYGENAVLRLLAEQTQINRLDDLALTDSDKLKIRRSVERPYGMILATGPTGSGKSTTLYTILKELNKREISIITIEDPIEYSLEGVDQIQANPRTGLTFAAGLRSILRQDPNVIMVGEIRDEETASIAVNAALTGHKMLSTLHTNDAATTLPRLLDMGVEPFLVASTVNIAIGQRLVRMLCQQCKTAKRITDAEFQNLAAYLPPELIDNHRDFYYGKGCEACGGTGYFGRMGIYEVLEMNDFIREAIMRRADAGEIKKIAIKNGMITLLEDGFQKSLDGKTTIEEILRVIHE